MPRGDRTGPMGMGPMTGRGTGYCNGFTAPGYANPDGFAGKFARGYGCGFGHGRGYRNMFHASATPGCMWNAYSAYAGGNTAAFDEEQYLIKQASYLENQLEQVKKRLSSLKDEAE